MVLTIQGHHGNRTDRRLRTIEAAPVTCASVIRDESGRRHFIQNFQCIRVGEISGADCGERGREECVPVKQNVSAKRFIPATAYRRDNSTMIWLVYCVPADGRFDCLQNRSDFRALLMRLFELNELLIESLLDFLNTSRLPRADPNRLIECG